MRTRGWSTDAPAFWKALMALLRWYTLPRQDTVAMPLSSKISPAWSWIRRLLDSASVVSRVCGVQCVRTDVTQHLVPLREDDDAVVVVVLDQILDVHE